MKELSDLGEVLEAVANYILVSNGKPYICKWETLGRTADRINALTYRIKEPDESSRHD